MAPHWPNTSIRRKDSRRAFDLQVSWQLETPADRISDGGVVLVPEAKEVDGPLRRYHELGLARPCVMVVWRTHLIAKSAENHKSKDRKSCLSSTLPLRTWPWPNTVVPRTGRKKLDRRKVVYKSRTLLEAALKEKPSFSKLKLHMRHTQIDTVAWEWQSNIVHGGINSSDYRMPKCLSTVWSNFATFTMSSFAFTVHTTSCQTAVTGFTDSEHCI